MHHFRSTWRWFAASRLMLFSAALLLTLVVSIPASRQSTRAIAPDLLTHAKVGDILVNRSERPLGLAQTVFYGGYWTHAQIVVHNDGNRIWVVEATPRLDAPSRVAMRLLDDTAFHAAVDYALLRVDTIASASLPPHLAAADHLGAPFSWSLFDKHNPSAFYCSQLIWHVFAKSAGIDLDSDQSDQSILTTFASPLGALAVTPDDIYFSPHSRPVVASDVSPLRALWRRFVWAFGPADVVFVLALIGISLRTSTKKQRPLSGMAQEADDATNDSIQSPTLFMDRRQWQFARRMSVPDADADHRTRPPP